MPAARLYAALTALVVGFSAPTFASGRVELELAVEDRLPAAERQLWLQRLSAAGVENFRIRSVRPGDETKIEQRGTKESPVYAVTGIITSDNQLTVPGARFRATQAGQIATWVRDLAEQGPPAERPKTTAFGLTVEQFTRLQDDLARPLGFDTQGMSRADVIRRVAKGMSTRLVAQPSMAKPLSEDLVAEDLSTLSRGTALAYVLRSPGLCLVPRKSAGNVFLSIVAAKPNMEIWPIGWKPQKPGKDVAPDLYELVDVSVSGVAVTKVIDAVAERLRIPILLDHNAVARYGLEPDRVIAKFPSRRATYSRMLTSVLFQARLAMELRTDDAGKPFIWVTSLKAL